MQKFSTVANDTQAMYGTSSHAAGFEKREKLNIVRMITTTIKIIFNVNSGISSLITIKL
jgi:hypothetical protein